MRYDWVFVVVLVVGTLSISRAPLASEPGAVSQPGLKEGLVGYWKLQGDCRDSSGAANHGTNHGVNLETSEFDGRGAFIEVPASESLNFGMKGFSLSVWVKAADSFEDVRGDILSKFNPTKRNGFNFQLRSSSGGYQSAGDDRQVFFGIDNARLSDWQDCGRPSPTSNYVSNSLTVFDGHLYAANTDAADPKDWCHVYRYEGDDKWTDCGRVGQGKTTGVMSLIVHQGHLYAATSTYDWTRVFSGDYDPARVYRYLGGTEWEDCGQPGSNLRINCIASFQGKLYVGGDRGLPKPGDKQWSGSPYHVHVYEGGTKWSVAATFPAEWPKNCYPHAMAVHDGHLFVGYPNVYKFDGSTWEFAGLPIGLTPEDQKPFLQAHSLEVYQGQLYAGMWPEARAVMYKGGQEWEDRGMLGDGTEINAFTVYNGKLYGGAIPRAELSRYDGDSKWTSLKRFYSPDGWDPGSPTGATRDELLNWTRLTSLTVFQGRMFASIGSCTSALADAPADVRGKVFSIEAGKCVQYDRDLGPGWHHVVAMRQGNKLRLFVDGKPAGESTAFASEDYDLSNDEPLRIGFGETDYFTGQLREVRVYNRALAEKEIAELASKPVASE